MELLAEGRTAEVFDYGDGRVLKLDRPEWTGLTTYEGEVLGRLADAGLPVARAHGTVTIDGRTGVILERVDGRSLLHRLAGLSPAEAEAVASDFAALHGRINGTSVAGLPELVPRLGAELEAVVDTGLRAELIGLLAQLDDGDRGVCHYDFHPDNVLEGPDGWVVIDWLTVASGPAAADLGRTLVLLGRWGDEPFTSFVRVVRRRGLEQRGLADEALDGWVRVAAAARLGEGFTDEYAEWLLGIARGDERLFA